MKTLTISDLDALRAAIHERQAERDKAAAERNMLLPRVAADPGSASKLRKLNATISEANTDLQTLEDALVDAEEQLEVELRRQRLEQSLAVRQRAASGASELCKFGAAADRAVQAYLQAMRELREAASVVSADCLQAFREMHGEWASLDQLSLVLPRASASGTEVAEAVAVHVRDIAQSTKAPLGKFLTLNTFAVPRGTLESALTEGAKLIASRLDVKVD